MYISYTQAALVAGVMVAATVLAAIGVIEAAAVVSIFNLILGGVLVAVNPKRPSE